MKAILSRSYGKFSTLGSLFVFNGKDKVFNCVTIELPDLGNQHNVSCIPEGKYGCTLITRPNGKKAYLLENVQGRDNILIHTGNYTSDTLGCILPGKYFVDLNLDGNLDVAESSDTMKKLIDILKDNFTLYII